jgi:hypothetical protein
MAFGSPKLIQRPGGESDIAVLGPNHDIDFYYNSLGSATWGKSDVTPVGVAHSAPAMVQRASGETNIVVVGPNHQLDFYFNAMGSNTWGRVAIAGAGAAL